MGVYNVYTMSTGAVKLEYHARFVRAGDAAMLTAPLRRTLKRNGKEPRPYADHVHRSALSRPLYVTDEA